MSSQVVRVKGGYNYARAHAEAQKHSAYYEEGLCIDVAARVIDAMATRGVTRSALARRLAVSPAYITKVLHGHANLSLESLAKLAFALDLKWECVLIPKRAEVALLSWTDESGVAAIRTVETATMEAAGGAAAQDEDAYEEAVHTEGHHEVSVPA